jgi:hypothetical protein
MHLKTVIMFRYVTLESDSLLSMTSMSNLTNKIGLITRAGTGSGCRPARASGIRVDAVKLRTQELQSFKELLLC